MTSGYLPSTVGAGDLVAELAAAATETGANTGLWPGLTIYRFTAPVGPTWEEWHSPPDGLLRRGGAQAL